MYTRLVHYAKALAEMHKPLLLLMPRDRVLAVTGREWGIHQPKKKLTLTLLTHPESTKYSLDPKIKYCTNFAIDYALEGSIAEANRLMREADALIDKDSKTDEPILTKAKQAESLAIHALILQAANKPKESIKTLKQAIALMDTIYSYRRAVFSEYEQIIKITALMAMKYGEYNKAENIFKEIWAELNFPGSWSIPSKSIASINLSSLLIIQGKPQPAQIILEDCLKYTDPVCDLMLDVATHNLRTLKECLSKAQQPSAPPELFKFSLT